MAKIIVVSHGSFAQGLVNSAALIAGECKDAQFFGLELGIDLDEFKLTLENAISTALQESPVLVITDLMYGTPFNMVSQLMDKYHFHHICGINMPTYLEIVTSYQTTELDELCKNFQFLGSSSFIYVNDFL